MSDYASRIIKGAMVASAGGLDLDTAGRALQDATDALAKQAEALKKARYDPKKPESVSRAFTYTAKVIDEITRLTAFARGQPDSRPDFGTDWLQALTDKQFSQVKTWIEENERTDAEKEAGMDEDEAHHRG